MTATATPQEILQQYFGYKSFREGQQEVIEQILAGRDVLAIMPTGAGKSLCYQVPALLLPGVTLVISPLISLMKDQVGALVQAGVAAAFLNSYLSAGQYREALRRAAQMRYKIIYVAPERLRTEGFRGLCQEIPISLVTVDEAHCVSQWGQDFRPSYLQIPRFLEELPRRPVLGAFTATATTRVKEDIATMLELARPYRITTGFNRPNLYFEVQKPQRKIDTLIRLVQERKDKSGIVYCSTRKGVEEVTNRLCAAGFAATRYHAGLLDQERHDNQEDFLYDRKTVMVATNAFGMGIDKANVGYVIHYNMPKNIESYYQEAGRAGRDGDPADCILLYGAQDERTARFLIERSLEGNDELSAQECEQLREKDYALLRQMIRYCATSQCLRGYILNYFGEQAPADCGNCGNCRAEFDGVDVTEEALAVAACLEQLQRRRLSFGKTALCDILRGSENERILRLGLNRLLSYGSLQGRSLNFLKRVVDFLTQEGYLETADGEFPTLALSERGKLLLAHEGRLEMQEQKQQRGRVEGPAATDDALYRKLKALRAELAKEAGVPAFVIFSNATLRDICRVLPQDDDSFLQVSGVGWAKLERYGAPFTRLVREHLAGE